MGMTRLQANGGNQVSINYCSQHPLPLAKWWGWRQLNSNNIWRATGSLRGRALQWEKAEPVIYVGHTHTVSLLGGGKSTYWTKKTPSTAMRKKMLLEEASKVKTYNPSCDHFGHSSQSQAKAQKQDLKL